MSSKYPRTPEERQASKRRRRVQREAIADRRRKAWQLHMAGVGYQAIADQLGVNVATAHRDVKRILAALHKERIDDADLERAKSLARLERLIQGLFSKAIKGDHKAADTIRKLEADRIRLLGLAPAVKAEITGKDGGPLEIQAGVVLVPAVAGSVQAWRDQVEQSQAGGDVVALRALEGGSDA